MTNETLKLKPIKYDTVKKAAPIWKRIAAALIDSLFFILPTLLSFKFNTNIILSEVTMIALGIIGVLYKVILTYRYGGTIGKLAMKIRVVNCDLQRVTLKQSVLRVIVDAILLVINWTIRVLAISEIGLDNFTTLTNLERGKLIIETSVLYPIYMKVNQFWSISNVLSVLINSNNRALHDFIAGTIVVKKEYAEECR